MECAAAIDGYLTAMGIEHQAISAGDAFLVTYRMGDETLNLVITCSPTNVLITAPRLVTVPRGRRHVLLRLLERAWETYMPRYELDRSDGELRRLMVR